MSRQEFNNSINEKQSHIENALISKIGTIGKFSLLKYLYKVKIDFSKSKFFDERIIPRRMYSYIAQK